MKCRSIRQNSQMIAFKCWNDKYMLVVMLFTCLYFLLMKEIRKHLFKETGLMVPVADCYRSLLS